MELVELVEAIANLQAAVRYLASLENVDESQVSSLGWCFGGRQSLQLALNTEPDYSLASTVIYYGRLVTDPEELSKIEWPILGIFGDRDNSYPIPFLVFVCQIKHTLFSFRKHDNCV